ncbi:adenylate cyclase [Capronia epimyces CBS 606.96]|uniref:Adenylate cyclase n=1 Tax=Capronia epimyces CBS 606.96 TaxID=1182542 RepID=W9YK83_9EURO|nr:adenylate cyclase [Capronia epimyces CBS 606.96]EXJ90095.1 adenylate cyclase [Capronia epimyces CBS 606.96]
MADHTPPPNPPLSDEHENEAGQSQIEIHAHTHIEAGGRKSTDGQSSAPLVNSSGWDGKLRMPPRNAVLTNPEALSDPDYSDPEAPPVEQIEADEDLLDDYPLDTEDIDLVHCRISSLVALKLERFTNAKRLCLRQNAIQSIALTPNLGETLEELDLYDNLISHIKGLDDIKNLRSLDLSFNKIKHIKNVNHLRSLKELYFVQNRISKIENLDGLENLTMIELGANRIREIENLETLHTLHELWLGKNKITEIKGLSSLTSLKLLDLKSNRLTTITGLESLSNLEELYVSHNGITEISPASLANNLKLRVLDLSNNQISHLANIGHLKELEEVWASSNKLADFREVERELADKEHLETVYFEMNPLQLASPALYRNKVRLALPQIKQIDASKLITPRHGLRV